MKTVTSSCCVTAKESRTTCAAQSAAVVKDFPTSRSLSHQVKRWLDNLGPHRPVSPSLDVQVQHKLVEERLIGVVIRKRLSRVQNLLSKRSGRTVKTGRSRITDKACLTIWGYQHT